MREFSKFQLYSRNNKESKRLLTKIFFSFSLKLLNFVQLSKCMTHTNFMDEWLSVCDTINFSHFFQLKNSTHE